MATPWAHQRQDGDCGKMFLDHAKEIVDEDTGPICPVAVLV